jgi:putative ABC transport system permease protein
VLDFRLSTLNFLFSAFSSSGITMPFEPLLQDIRYAVRSLSRAPGFVTVTILTLALGIGGTTGIFGLVRGVLFAPLPFANADRMVFAVNRGTRPGNDISALDFVDWREQLHRFDAVGVYTRGSANLTGGVEPVRFSIADVSANWFPMLGVALTLGPGFTPRDDISVPQLTVVLSDGAWRQQFGADPGVIGRTVLLDGTSYEIVGVAPPRFTFPDHPDLWRPLVVDPTSGQAKCRGCRFLSGPVGRLAPGVSFQEGRQEILAVTTRLHEQYAPAEAGVRFDIIPLRDHLVDRARPALLVLLGGVACLLIIACANVATLMLARAATRAPEIGVRVAIGADRWRIGRQLLVESLLLASIGAALGLALAAWGLRAVITARLGGLPLLEDVTIDIPVLVVAMAVTITTGVLCGLAPLAQVAGANGAAALRSQARGTSMSKGTARVRAGLVIAEIALAVPLLIGAALLGQSLYRLMAADAGFKPEHLVRLDIALPQCGTRWAPDSTCAISRDNRYMSSTQILNFTNDLLSRLRALPGTEQVSVAAGAPFSDWASGQTFAQIEGVPEAPDARRIALIKVVSRDYFATLGIPLRSGRLFTPDDRPQSPPVALVDEAFVRAFLPTDDPIGKAVTNVGRIVGVVGDTKNADLITAVRPTMYVSADQGAVPFMTVLIRSTAAPGGVLTAARRQLAAIDNTVTPYHVMTMEDAVRGASASPRVNAWLVSTFAIGALLLAMIGIYGIMSYGVRARRRELGLRVALGAPRGRIIRLVLGNGIRMTAIGTGIGLIISLLGCRALRSLLFDVAPTDVSTYAVVCSVVGIVAVMAAWVPALRAAAVDPMIAMRIE